MTELSDWKRAVYEPEKAEFEATIRLLRGRIAELEPAACIGASVMPRPQLSKEAIESLEELHDAMDCVDDQGATSLRALLDWYKSYALPAPEKTKELI